MNITIKTNDKTIAAAVELYRKYYNHPDYFLLIARHGRFNECEKVGFDLVNEIKERQKNFSVAIDTYRKWNPWSATIAYHQGDSIMFNVWKTGTVWSRLKTIKHEIYHELGFHHKGEKANDYNLKTLPYAGSQLFCEFVRARESLKVVA